MNTFQIRFMLLCIGIAVFCIAHGLLLHDAIRPAEAKRSFILGGFILLIGLVGASIPISTNNPISNSETEAYVPYIDGPQEKDGDLDEGHFTIDIGTH